MVAAGLSSALVQRKTVDREHLQTGLALGLLAGLALARTDAGGGQPDRRADLRRAHGLLRAADGAAVPRLARSTRCRWPRSGRRMAFRRLSEIEVLSTVVRVAVCIGLALAGLGGEALVLGMLAGAPGGDGHRLGQRTAAAAAAAARRRARAAGLSACRCRWPRSAGSASATSTTRSSARAWARCRQAFTTAPTRWPSNTRAKIAIVMTQVGFPVLSRTSSTDELTQLYRQMVRLLTIVLFPLLVLLAITRARARPVPLRASLGRGGRAGADPGAGGGVDARHQRRRDGADGDRPRARAPRLRVGALPRVRG